MGGPNSYIIFPETVLTGENNVVSVQPNTDGEYPGQGSADLNNTGSLTVVQTGTYKEGVSTSAKKTNYRVCDAGSNFAGATYGWKPSTDLVSLGDGAFLVDSTNALAAGDLILNRISIGDSNKFDILSVDSNDQSALSKSIAINLKKDLHGITATGATVWAPWANVGAGTVGSGDILINDVDIRAGSDIVVTANDGTGTLEAAINAKTWKTGVTGDLAAGTMRLTSGGCNIKLELSDSGATILNGLGGAVSLTQFGYITLTHETHIEIRGANPVYIGSVFADGYYQTREWYGYDDMRYFYAEHGGMLTKPGYGACSVFCKLAMRELLYVAEAAPGEGETTSTLRISYHDVRSEYDDWTSTTVELDKEFATGFGDHRAALQVCAMRDGSLRLLTQQNGRDWVLWHSTDGLVWNRINDNILRRFTTDLMQASLWPRMDASGDFLRIAWMDYTSTGTGSHEALTYYLRTIVSSDGGASFTEPTFSLSPYTISEDGKGSDYFIWTMAALGDESGTFYLHFSTGSLTRNFYARRLDGWADTTIFFANAAWNTTTQGAHLGAVRGPDYYYVFFQFRQPSGNPSAAWIAEGASMTVYEIDPSEPLSSTSWRRLGISGQWDGTCKFQPALISLVNCGDYISMFGALVDNDTDAATLEADNTCYLRFGKWDKKPIKETYPESFQTSAIEDLVTLTHQPTRTLYRLSWNAAFGAPAPASNASASSDTTWTRDRHQTTQSWNAWRFKLEDQATVGNYGIYTFSDTANLTTHNAPIWGVTPSIANIAGSCIECEMRIEQIEEGIHTTEIVFFGVKSFYGTTSTSTRQLEIALYFHQNGFVVWDKISDSLATTGVTGLDMTEFHLFRMVFRPNPGTDSSRCQIWYKQIGDFGENEWGHTPVFTPTLNSGPESFSQSIHFGHGNVSYGSTKRISQWRRIAVLDYTDCNQLEDDDVRWPDEMRGHLVTQNPVLIDNHASARWGGGGGMDNDYFTAEADSNYAVSNVFIDSPRIEWRSESHGVDELTDGQIVLVADPNDEFARIRFEGIAFFNTNFLSTFIEWSDDGTTWASVEDAIDTPLISATIYSIGEKFFILDLPSQGKPIIGQMQTNQNNTYYLQFKSTVDETTKFYTVKINKLDYIDGDKFSVYLDTDKNLKAYFGDELGAPVTIHSNQWAYRATASGSFQPQMYGVRYLRFTTTGSYPSAEGYWKVGRIVLGPVLDLGVPLEWTLENNQQPNVTKYRTRSAIQWAFVEGPPQRTIKGRIVGDVKEQERMKLRYSLQKYSEYEKKSCVLVKDSTSYYGSESDSNYTRQNCNPDNVILGRIANGSPLDQIAWYQDVDGIWKQAGDVEIEFTEEV